MATSAKPCRWGILGAGAISSDFCRALRITPGAQITAVAARSQAKAKEFAAKHDIEHAFGSYEELASSSAVDIVYVGTIHPSHYECVRTVLSRGKSVLCEKPMCMNAGETQALVALARQKGVFLMEGMWTRFFPAVVKALELIEQKAIGDVVEVIADFGFASKVSDASRLYNLEMGGGGLLDIGIYVLASAAFIWGASPTDVRAVGWREATGADSCGAIALKYGAGEAAGAAPRIASLTYSMRTATREFAVYQGTAGKISLWPSHCPTQLTLEKDGEAPVRLEFALPEPSSYNFTNSSGFKYQVERIQQLLAQGATECPEWPLQMTVDMARLMDTVRVQLGVIYPKHDGIVTRVRALLHSWPRSSHVLGALALWLAFALAARPGRSRGAAA